MIYLDSAATSLLKPRSVPVAMTKAVQTMASPGRGGYRAAQLAADTAYACREEIAGLFHLKDPSYVVFTSNATHALNIAIHSLVHPGTRVLVSGYEHNSVMRPLQALSADVHVLRTPLFNTEILLRQFAQWIPEVDVVICTHVSNVFGYISPIDEIAALCRQANVKLVVDASQSAGIIELNFQNLGAQFAAMPGHKGLLGPQGTGILLCADENVSPYMYGGTGSSSKSPAMPDFLPDRLEAGTHNIPGISGLLAGVRAVRQLGLSNIAEHENRLKTQMTEMLQKIPGVRIFSGEQQSGVLSILVPGVPCEFIAEELGKRGVAVRSGLHCAPYAHETAGTLETGTVRFSFSPYNTTRDIIQASKVLSGILNATSPSHSGGLGNI